MKIKPLFLKCWGILPVGSTQRAGCLGVIMESTRVNQSLIPSFLSPSPNHLCKVPSLIPVHSVVGSVMENFPQASLTSSEDVCKR